MAGHRTRREVRAQKKAQWQATHSNTKAQSPLEARTIPKRVVREVFAKPIKPVDLPQYGKYQPSAVSAYQPPANQSVVPDYLTPPSVLFDGQSVPLPHLDAVKQRWNPLNQRWGGSPAPSLGALLKDGPWRLRPGVQVQEWLDGVVVLEAMGAGDAADALWEMGANELIPSLGYGQNINPLPVLEGIRNTYLASRGANPLMFA